MDDNQRFLLSEWMSGITGAICQIDQLSVEQKRLLLDDLVRFKMSVGLAHEQEDPEAT